MMKSLSQSDTLSQPSSDKFALDKFFTKLKLKWYWLLIGLLVGLGLSYLFVSYFGLKYEANATVKINLETSQVPEFSEKQVSRSKGEEALGEIELLKSRKLVSQAIESLPLAILYEKENIIGKKKYYTRSPIRISINEGENLPYNIEFSMKVLDKENFVLSYEVSGEKYALNSSFGKRLKADGVIFTINRSEEYGVSIAPGTILTFRSPHPQTYLQKVIENLEVVQLNNAPSVLNVTYKDFSAELARDLVSALCNAYVNYDVQQRGRIFSQTLEFINQKEKELKDTVAILEYGIAKFKRNNRIVDIESQVKVEIDQLQEMEVKKQELQLQLLNIKSLGTELSEDRQLSNVTYNLQGIVDANLNSLISRLNDLYIERSSLGSRYTQTSPAAIALENQITEVKRSIEANIVQAESKIEDRLNFYTNQIAVLGTKIGDLPEAQREYVNLVRDFEVKENVYSFLQTKRLETAVLMASVVPSARIIDEPLAPVEPVILPIYIYVILGSLGMIMAAGAIFLVSFFDNTIYDRQTIEALTEIPVIGTIFKDNSKIEYPTVDSLADPYSLFNESLRALRASLQFLASDKSSKLITVSSSVVAEGKTLICSSLAGVISALGKKVIVLDLDLRKPKIHKALGTDNDYGMSTLLNGQNHLSKVVRTLASSPGFDFITAGPVSHNPAELIQSDLFYALLEDLKTRYDYILVDTSPVGLTADAIPLLKMADINLYVIKAGYSKHSFVRVLENLRVKRKIENLYVVLNNYDPSKSSYDNIENSKYYKGYLESDKKKWWKGNA